VDIPTYVLPKELRKEFRKPFGQFFKSTREARALLEGRRIISVGDIISYNLLRNSIEPDILVYDEKERRMETSVEVRKVIYDFEARFVIVKNPPGYVTHEVWETVKECLREKEKVKIFVDGEEDLVAFPFMLEAKGGDAILYGLNDGFVVSIVDDELKKKCKHLLSKMKKVTIRI